MIAVTGASSQIGRYLVFHLLEKGKQVRILADKDEPFADLAERDGLEVIRGSIMDITDLEILIDGATTVYHADGLESLVTINKRSLYQKNVDGTANVVNVALAAGVSKLIAFSSIYSLGDKSENGKFDESTRWSSMKEASSYEWSRHLAEREVWRGVTEGLPSIILQTGLVLSEPGVPSIATEVLDRCLRLAPKYPPGVANLIDVRDVVNIAVRLAESETQNEQFLLVGHQVSYKDLMNSMSQLSEKRLPVRELSYVNLYRRSLISRSVSFLRKRKNPFMTQALAQVMCDRRSFSNKKVSELLAYQFIDLNETVRHYGVT